MIKDRNQIHFLLNGLRSRSRNRNGLRSRSARADATIELDRSSIARLLEKLRDEDHHTLEERSTKRSYDRRRSERNRRSQSERHEEDDLELDYLLSSKNSNRSDRSKRSERHRSRSKQDSSIDIEAA